MHGFTKNESGDHFTAIQLEPLQEYDGTKEKRVVALSETDLSGDRTVSNVVYVKI